MEKLFKLKSLSENFEYEFDSFEEVGIFLLDVINKNNTNLVKPEISKISTDKIDLNNYTLTTFHEILKIYVPVYEVVAYKPDEDFVPIYIDLSSTPADERLYCVWKFENTAENYFDLKITSADYPNSSRDFEFLFGPANEYECKKYVRNKNIELRSIQKQRQLDWEDERNELLKEYANENEDSGDWRKDTFDALTEGNYGDYDDYDGDISDLYDEIGR